MEFISNLDELLKKSDYKTKFIEKELKVNKNTISNWRNSKTVPTIIQALKLAELLNCDVNDIYKLKKENIADGKSG